MRLLTHNMLICAKKSCSRAGAVNFPLNIRATKTEKVPIEFNKDFVLRMIPRLDWRALVLSASQVTVVIPAEPPANLAENDELLHNLHTVLMEIHILEGELVCPGCQRVYPIRDGIPNMLLNEDEVQ